MELAVNIQIDGTFVLYTVKHVIDGIYIASLIKTSYTEFVITPPRKKYFCIKERMDGNQTIVKNKLGYVLVER